VSELEEKIMGILAENDIPHELFEHEPVHTNPEMAEKLGVKTDDTIKNLVLATDDGRTIQVILPGNKRFDSKRIARKANARRVSFAKPEKVLEVAGCEVGCVPPFGHLQPIQIYMDRAVFWKKHIYFNPGVHHKSVKIPSAHLKQLCKPIML